MAENEISDYLEADADNTDIAGISVQENVMRPPAVNNAFRALQGALKRWFKASLFRLRDGTDQTKLLAFDLSAIPTATTLTNSFPSFAGGVSVEARGTAIVAAATTNLSTASGNYVHVTGNTTITSFGTAAAGIARRVVFDGTPLLTNGANLILLNAVDLRAAAGDSAVFVSEGSGAWKCITYARAASTPYLALGTVAQVGGVPTGAAMERGSNANGDWERFANGTQICRKTVTTDALDDVAGAIFSTGASNWTFPIAFVSGVVAAYGTDSTSSNIWVGTGNVSTTSVEIRAFCFAVSGARTLSMVAVGRWF